MSVKRSSWLAAIIILSVLGLAAGVGMVVHLRIANRPERVAGRLATQCEFKLPSTVYELNAVSWRSRSFPNAVEWTLLSVATDRSGVEELRASFAKPPVLIEHGRFVRDETFCRRASWWKLHEYSTREVFAIAVVGQVSGTLYVNVVDEPTNCIVYMAATLR